MNILETTNNNNLEVSRNNTLISSKLPPNMDYEEIVEELYNYMKKEQMVKQYCDTSKIKERKTGNYTQFYICIKDSFISAKSRPALINKLYDIFCGHYASTLEEAFVEWMQWRRSEDISSKTLKENKNEWNGYIKNSALAKMQVAKIEITHLENFLSDVTKGYAITSQRLSNIISVLNGIFRRCVSRHIIAHNLLADVDRKPYYRRIPKGI